MISVQNDTEKVQLRLLYERQAQGLTSGDDTVFAKYISASRGRFSQPMMTYSTKGRLRVTQAEPAQRCHWVKTVS
jgi:hypothetical protein